MSFLLICIVSGLLVASLLLRPLLRTSSGPAEQNADLSVYRDQLATLDAEIARGAIDTAEAETTRLELSRRLLAADAATAQQQGAAPAGANRLAIAATLLVVLVGGAAGYLMLGSFGRPDAPLAPRIAQAEALRRPPQSVVEAMFAAQSPAPELSARDEELITQLAAIVASRPDDLEGRRLLARSYMQLGRFLEGKQNQTELVERAGPDADVADIAALAEYMIVAAGGYISPEAEEVVNRTLALSPDDPWSLYYLARIRAQTGDTQTAIEMYTALAADAATPQDLLGAIRVDLAELTVTTGSTDDQRELIDGMVSGLAQRLATQGGTVAEWDRLIRAYDVLGRTQDADAIHAEALATFANDPDAIALLGDRP